MPDRPRLLLVVLFCFLGVVLTAGLVLRDLQSGRGFMGMGVPYPPVQQLPTPPRSVR